MTTKTRRSARFGSAEMEAEPKVVHTDDGESGQREQLEGPLVKSRKKSDVGRDMFRDTSSSSSGNNEHEYESSGNLKVCSSVPESGSLNDDEVDDDASSSSSPPAKYAMGDRVWVREQKWGGVYYEAVIRRAAIWGPRRKMLAPAQSTVQSAVNEEPEWCWHYFLHHVGWNTKWDAFAEERDIFPDTPEIRATAKRTQQQMKNRKKSAADLKAIEAQKKAEEKQREEEEAAALAAAKKKKVRQTAREIKLKEQNLSLERGKVEHANRLPIPQPLINHLVSEWEIISPNKNEPLSITRRLHILPARVTVKDALLLYLKSKLDLCKEDDDKEKREQWVEMCEGVESLFNTMIRRFLYPEELIQLNEMEKTERFSIREKSEIYGCFHLVRLATVLPSMLVSNQQNEISGITGKMADLVRFLYKNEKDFFHASYREPTKNELSAEERLALKPEKPGAKRKAKSVGM